MLNTIKRLWTGSIRRQLMLGIALVHAVLMTIFVFDLVHRQRTFLQDQSVSNTLSLAQTLASNSVSWVLAQDVIGLEEVVNSQSSFPDLLYAMILSPDGKVLGHSDRSKVGLYIDDPVSSSLINARVEAQNLLINDALIDIAAPIIANDRLIGWARVATSQESINAGLKIIIRDGAWYTLFAILVGSIFALIMARGLTQGIQHLVEVTNRVREGDEEIRPRVQRDDELGRLSRTLNKMLDTILAQKNKILNVQHKQQQTLFEYEKTVEQLQKSNVRLNQEIGKRQAAEKTVADEKEQLAVTLASIGDGVITTDIEGTIQLLNPVAEELTGWTLADAVGRPLHKIFKVICQDYETVCTDPVHRVMELGRISQEGDDILLEDKNGFRRAISESGSPIRDRDDQVIGVVFVFHDTTEEHKMREQVFKTKKLESIGVLAGGIAHDFNNILTGMLGNISLAKLYVDQEGQALPLLESAEQASFRARKLTQQLLTFSKGGEPIRENASLPQIIKETAEFALSGSSVKCTYSFANDLSGAFIDKGQISQVIQNLILNSIQAMPGGGTIDLSCENLRVAPDSQLPLTRGEYVMMTIRDTGVGIQPENVSRVFDPYYSTKQQGSGLGLAICHSIILKHDGYITVQSSPGKGTCFTVYLPATREEAKESSEKKNTFEPGSGTVMVMDDEKIIRAVSRSMLENGGYTAITVKDGEEALARYQQQMETGEPVDLVIMDLTIPGGMGGKVAVAKLLEIDPAAKVIVSSGYSNDPVVADYAAYGFTASVSKPYSLKELLETVQQVLDNDNNVNNGN